MPPGSHHTNDPQPVTKAILTTHAEQRTIERCSLSVEDLKRYLDNGLTIPLAFAKGGRIAKRLLYSAPDQTWFVVVQDTTDGVVITVLPLDYLKDRIPFTAAQKRSVRRRNIDFLAKPSEGQPTSISNVTKDPEPAPLPLRPQTGWRIRITFTIEGQTRVTALPRTLPEHGEPADWAQPGHVHGWLRDRILENGIPFRAIHGLTACRGKAFTEAACLLEHLPLTQAEIDSCR